LEHLRHFGLTDDPFRNEPQPGAYLQTQAHGDALLRIERGARQAKGFTLLLGASGAGKTMILRQLYDKLEEEVFEASMLVVLSPTADADWTLRRYARELGVEEPASDRETLYAQVYDRLSIVREDGRHSVLIIDDAEELASTDALHELVALLKLGYEDRRLVSLILAGDEVLEAAVREIPALANRVDIAVKLTGLDEEATAEYIAHRMSLCSGDPSMIEPAALDAIRKSGSGLPGRMNTLTDNALFEAYRAERPRITKADVERVCAALSWAYISSEGQTENVATKEGEGESAAEPLVALEAVYTELDAEFEAVFESATILEPEPENRSLKRSAGLREVPIDGPPKEPEEEVEDLLVELMDD